MMLFLRSNHTDHSKVCFTGSFIISPTYFIICHLNKQTVINKSSKKKYHESKHENSLENENLSCK